MNQNKFEFKRLEGFASSVIISVMSALISVALIGLAWYILIPQLKTLNQSIFTAESEVKDLTDKLAEIKKARNIIDNLAPTLKKIELSLPEKIETPELILMVNSLAQESGLASMENALNPAVAGSDEKSTDYESAKLDLSVTGSYESIIAFLDNIYRNIRPIKIEAVSLVPSTEEGQESSIEAEFRAITYFRGEPKAESSASGPPAAVPAATTTPTPATTPTPTAK